MPLRDGGVLAAPAGAGCSRCTRCEGRGAAVMAGPAGRLAHPVTAGAIIRSYARYGVVNGDVQGFIPWQWGGGPMW